MTWKKATEDDGKQKRTHKVVEDDIGSLKNKKTPYIITKDGHDNQLTVQGKVANQDRTHRQGLIVNTLDFDIDHWPYLKKIRET